MKKHRHTIFFEIKTLNESSFLSADIFSHKVPWLCFHFSHFSLGVNFIKIYSQFFLSTQDEKLAFSAQIGQMVKVILQKKLTILWLNCVPQSEKYVLMKLNGEYFAKHCASDNFHLGKMSVEINPYYLNHLIKRCLIINNVWKHFLFVKIAVM